MLVVNVEFVVIVLNLPLTPVIVLVVNVEFVVIVLNAPFAVESVLISP